MFNVITLKKNKPVQECRICIQPINIRKKMFSLFEAWDPPWEGMEATIADDLNRLTNIEVTRTDVLSKVICEPCYDYLQSACYFVKFVQKNDLILKKSVQAENDTSEKTGWPQPIQLETNINSVIYDSRMEVEVKQEVISDEEDLETDYRVSEQCLEGVEVKAEPEEITPQNPVSNGISMGILRPNANTLTNGDVYLSEEYLESVKEEILSEDESQLASWDLSLDCQLCSKGFKCISGLKAHVIAHHSYKSVRRRPKGSTSPEKRPRSDTHVCATCRRTFATPTDLMVHESCHGVFACYVCKNIFDTFEQLTGHRAKCSLAKSKGGEARLKTLDDVKRNQHASINTQPKKEAPLTCPLCPEQFSDPYYLSIHQEIHHSTSNKELNEACNSELANQSELSQAINKVLERVSESLGMEDDNADSERLEHESKPSEAVNRVLERMRKSLGVVEDTEDSASNDLSANENAPSAVINSDLQRVTGTSGLDDSVSELLVKQNNPSDIDGRVHEKVSGSLAVEKEKNDLSNFAQTQTSITVDSVLERVSDSPTYSNGTSDKVTEVLERAVDSLVTEKETVDCNSEQSATANKPSGNVAIQQIQSTVAAKENIEDSSSGDIALQSEPSDVTDKVMVTEVEDTEATKVNEVNAEVEENMEGINGDRDTESINRGVGSEHIVTEGATNDNVDNGMEIDISIKEADECGNNNIENIFPTSVNILGQSGAEKSVDLNVVAVSEDVGDVNKLPFTANVEVNVGSLGDLTHSIPGSEQLLGRGNALDCSADKLLENQVREMDIDNIETACETLDSSIVALHNVKEGLQLRDAEKVSDN